MGFASGLSAGTQFRQQRQAEEQQQQLGQLNQQYQLGTPQEKQQILGQIAQYDSQQAQFLQQQQVAQQAQQQKTLQRAGKLAQTVMKADPKQRNSVYKASLKVAADYGMDVSQLPQEYDDDAAEQLQSIIGMTQEQDQISYGKVPEGSYLDKETKQLKQMEGFSKSDEDRKIIKDASGRQRFVDTGELAFPDLKQTESPEQQAKREKVKFDKTTTLRKEFTANSKDFVKVRDAHNRIKASASDPSAAGDLALIFNYMKVLDPGSTVREGEFATAESSGSVPARIVARYNKVLEGERLAPGQRDDFVSRAEKLYDAQLSSQKRLVKKYENISDRSGVDKQDVLLGFATPEEAQPQKQLSEMSMEELQALRQQTGGQ